MLITTINTNDSLYVGESPIIIFVAAGLVQLNSFSMQRVVL